MLHHYSLLDLLGWSPSSLVVLAEDRRFLEACGVSKKVVLKVVWHPERAADEARKLQTLGPTGVSCRILTCFQIPGRRAIHAFRGLLNRLDELGFTMPVTEQTLVSVLVLEHIAGIHPFKLEEGAAGTPYERTITVEHAGVTLERREVLHKELIYGGTQVRLAFLLALVRSVQCCHHLGIVHGDLKPENLIWTGETVRLIDFGTWGQFGSPGWQSPVHLALEQGRISHLGQDADLWAIGQYVKALAFDPELEACQAIVDGCEQGRMDIHQVLCWLDYCQPGAYSYVS